MVHNRLHFFRVFFLVFVMSVLLLPGVLWPTFRPGWVSYRRAVVYPYCVMHVKGKQRGTGLLVIEKLDIGELDIGELVKESISFSDLVIKKVVKYFLCGRHISCFFFYLVR